MVNIEMHAAIVIDRPVDEVFRFVAVDHLANHRRWDPNVTDATAVGGGPLHLGSQFDLTRRTLGRTERLRFEVVEWQADRLIAIETRTPDLDLRLASDFTAIGAEAARMTLRATALVRGRRRLLAPLMRLKFRADLRRNLRTIKLLIESGARPQTALETAR